MKIALAQFNPTVGDFAGNSACILGLAAQAKQRGADLAVFSELCLGGYLPQDLLERPAFIPRNHTALKELAAKIPLASVVGYAGRVANATDKPIANKAAFLFRAPIDADTGRMLLSSYDILAEAR